MNTYQKSDEKNNLRWQYQLGWQIPNTMLNEWIERIHQTIREEARREKMTIEAVEINEQEISCQFSSPVQINSHTFCKKLQKQLEKAAKDHGMSQALQEPIVMSWSQEKAENDIRLNKWISTVREADYYDLDAGLDNEEIKRLKGYLLGQKLAVIEEDEKMIIIDREALQKKINLNCFECTKKYRYGCCCGSPCEMSDKNRQLLEDHLVEIEERVNQIDPVQYENLIHHGGVLAANGKIKSFDGHCALLVEEKGIYKCIAHQYALEQGIEVYEICPLSCLMYPFEVIELITNKHKKAFLFTAAVKGVPMLELSRWGNYEALEVGLRCVDETLEDEIFKEEKYRPVYQVNQKLIEHEFGKQVYTYIERCLKSIINRKM